MNEINFDDEHMALFMDDETFDEVMRDDDIEADREFRNRWFIPTSGGGDDDDDIEFDIVRRLSFSSCGNGVGSWDGLAEDLVIGGDVLVDDSEFDTDIYWAGTSSFSTPIRSKSTRRRSTTPPHTPTITQAPPHTPPHTPTTAQAPPPPPPPIKLPASIPKVRPSILCTHTQPPAAKRARRGPVHTFDPPKKYVDMLGNKPNYMCARCDETFATVDHKFAHQHSRDSLGQCILPTFATRFRGGNPAYFDIIVFE